MLKAQTKNGVKQLIMGDGTFFEKKTKNVIITIVREGDDWDLCDGAFSALDDSYGKENKKEEEK